MAWISLGLVLAIAARLWNDRALLWQTHVLALLAVGWTIYANFAPEYRGTRVQWMTVGITAAVFYALAWITNIAAVVEDERICQGYAWAGSLLLSWLAWYQLPPIYVTLAWGLFGLLLFELPVLARSLKINVRSTASWRMQAYVAAMIERARPAGRLRPDLDVDATAYLANALMLQLAEAGDPRAEDAILAAAARMIYHAIFVDEP